MCHYGLAIYRNSNISPCKNIISKKSSKKNQNPSRFYNFVTNLKFQHKPKYHLLKILIYKYTSYLGAGAKIPLAIILYNESKHNILALVGKAINFDKPMSNQNIFLDKSP
jgi:hypothetical protein